jgi:hypothetical protein
MCYGTKCAKLAVCVDRAHVKQREYEYVWFPANVPICVTIRDHAKEARFTCRIKRTTPSGARQADLMFEAMDLHECEGACHLDSEAPAQVRRVLNKRPVELLSGSLNGPSSPSSFYETVHQKIQKLRLTGEPESSVACTAPIVARRRVVLCEERNVSYPGRLVSSRDELRSYWLDRSDFKRIQGENIRSLVAIKREMSAGHCNSPHTTYSLTACPRGLELYVTKLQSPKRKCSPQRQLSRGVVQFYRQSPPPDPEQLRTAYRLLTQKDRLRALQVAYLDALEAQLLATTLLHSDLQLRPAAAAEPSQFRRSRSGGSCRAADAGVAPPFLAPLAAPPAHILSVVRFH